MTTLLQLLRDLHRDDSGQAMTEYTVLMVAIAIADIAAISYVGTRVSAMFDEALVELNKLPTP